MPSTFIVRPSAIHAPMHTVRSRISASVYGGTQPGEERVVDGEVVEREQLGVLDRQPLPIGVTRVRLPLGDVRVVGLGHHLLRARRLAPLLADRAVVDLRDAHARELALAHGMMLCSYTAWLSAPAPMPISGRSSHMRTSGSAVPSGMSMRGTGSS